MTFNTPYPDPTPEELDSILAEELISLQTTHPEEIDEFSPQSVFGDEN